MPPSTYFPRAINSLCLGLCYFHALLWWPADKPYKNRKISSRCRSNGGYSSQTCSVDVWRKTDRFLFQHHVLKRLTRPPCVRPMCHKCVKVCPGTVACYSHGSPKSLPRSAPSYKQNCLCWKQTKESIRTSVLRRGIYEQGVSALFDCLQASTTVGGELFTP